MLWHLLKFYMSFVIAVFFKRSKVKNAHYLRTKAPVILAMNHPNAFMDPVAFTVLAYPPRVYYLARGDAFKKGIVSRLLESLGIIPIFRIQDGGKEGLKKNDETYERVNTLLKRRNKIIIFAEGLCIQERRLRPLKKGVPRMVFGAMEEHQLKDLIVVPVGVNYSNPSAFRGNLFFNIGAPLKVNDYMEAYATAPAKTMNQFLSDLAPRMKELIVHIDHKHTEAVIAGIEDIYRYEYYEQQGLNLNDLEHDFLFSTKVVEVINKAEEREPVKVADLAEKTKRYTTELKKLQLKDWLINPAKQGQMNYGLLSLRILVLLLTLPIYLRGLAGSYVPYKLTELITRKKVRVIEFKASFTMGIGAVLFLLWGTLQFFIAKTLAPNAWWALGVLAVTVLTGLACLYLSPFRKKTRGIYRLVKLRASKPEVLESLEAQRRDIIASFESLIK
jgi:1-acyl-sn-glycerol-3-phosphate acyltransferase